MSRQHRRQYATPGVLVDPARGITFDWGVTVPADATAGYAPGALFLDVDAAAGLQLWINEGTRTSSSFKAIASVASGTVTGLVGAVGASTIALGTTTTDAGLLPSGALIYPTTAADDLVGVRIHATDQVTGRIMYIGNGVGNKILKIYPPTGGTIDGLAANAAYSTASGKGALMACLSGSGNTWFGIG